MYSILLYLCKNPKHKTPTSEGVYYIALFIFYNTLIKPQHPSSDNSLKPRDL